MQERNQHIKGVIFDLGRVLVGLDFSRGMPAWIRENIREDVISLTSFPAFLEYNAGRLTPEEFHRHSTATLNLPFTFQEFTQLWCDIFEPQPEMEQLVSRVAAHYPVNLLSDTDPLHWTFICRNFPWIPQRFPHPALSYRIGSLKPAPANFCAAAAGLGLRPEECLFIDDLPANIDGAQAVGMAGILFHTPGQLTAELVRRGILAD